MNLSQLTSLSIKTTTINDIILDILKNFDKNDKSFDNIRENELCLVGCEIKDEILNEIIINWLINKKFIIRIKALK